MYFSSVVMFLVFFLAFYVHIVFVFVSKMLSQFDNRKKKDNMKLSIKQR